MIVYVLVTKQRNGEVRQEIVPPSSINQLYSNGFSQNEGTVSLYKISLIWEGKGKGIGPCYSESNSVAPPGDTLTVTYSTHSLTDECGLLNDSSVKKIKS